MQGLTRQTQELDFSGLVQRSYRMREKAFDAVGDDSIVGTVDKDSALAFLEALDDAEEMKAQALSVSHAENVSEWIERLSAVQEETPQRLVDLQEKLKLPLVTVWLAALLGGFCVDQRGSFYETDEVWISSS